MVNWGEMVYTKLTVLKNTSGKGAVIMLQLQTKYAKDFLPEDWLESRLPALEKAATMLAEGNGPGGTFTGWVNLPRDYDKDEFARIQAAAERIRAQSEVLVVIGIGGSYLGARAALELLGSADPRMNTDKLQVFFAGSVS